MDSVGFNAKAADQTVHQIEEATDRSGIVQRVIIPTGCKYGFRVGSSYAARRERQLMYEREYRA
jgi:hypothetical protein